MPWILSNSTSTVWNVFWLVVACLYGGSVANRLLVVDFIGYVDGVCHYVVMFICNAI